jgi:flagellar basal body-associated protein FliL
MDEKTGKFREKTLLNRYKHQTNTPERSWPNRFSASRAFAEVRREAPALTNAAILCFGILVLAIVGFFVAGGRLSQFSPDVTAGRITYDLPAITATLNGGSTPQAVRLNLSLELRDKTDIPTVKRSLSRIVNAVIDGLETVSAERLAEKERIEQIRAELQSRIQSAARDARIEDVAVKKFQPF